jgi:hypothetical protein
MLPRSLLVALGPLRDLLHCAKHLFVAATWLALGRGEQGFPGWKALRIAPLTGSSSKIPEAPAVKREAEEECGNGAWS